MSKRDPRFPAMPRALACGIAGLLTAFIFCLLSCGALYAAEEDAEPHPSWLPQLLGAQVNAIFQNAPGFHNPYEGQRSFLFDHTFKQELTHVYGVYLGSQITSSLQVYADFEMFRGEGISGGYGLGGYTNGDVIRAGPADLGQSPYLARLFARYVVPLSNVMTEPLGRGMDQLPGPQPADRIEIKGGKLAPTDDFDLNRYANNQRTQFLNYAFLYNLSWDYASDTRGYSIGVSVAVVHPSWRLILGSYQEPTVANGYLLDDQIYHARGDNLELTVNPFGDTVIRLLAFRNEGQMGDYREAIATAAASSTIPDITQDSRPGHVKYGFGVNGEQPLADDGETGLFARIGWANGTNATWCYAEADRNASLGFQLSGSHWLRPDDRFGMAYGIEGLSGSHRHYLEAGGIGMEIGDGALNYGLEQVFEAYYRIQLGRYVQLSPDYQHIVNPAYNRDRGPVDVYGLRLRVSY